MSQLALDLIAKEAKEKTGYLELGNCGLTPDNPLLEQVWQELGNLTHLETLILSEWWIEKNKIKHSANKYKYNHIHSLPSSLSRLTDLRIFSCRGFGIKNIGLLASLTKMEKLDLYHNKISDISPIKELTNLKELDVEGNLITNIEPLKKLENLENLDISGNKVEDIAALLPLLKRKINPLQVSWRGMGEIIEGYVILLKGNPITNPPLEIVEQGRDAILNYYEQKQIQGTIPIYEAKMILVGEAGTGKTTLRKKLLNPNYPVPNEYDAKNSTHAIEVTSQVPFSFGNQPILVNIWDFGGQHNYYSTHRYFLTEWALYVLVVDERRENTRFEYWFQIIDLLAKDDTGQKTPILVLYNKRSGQPMKNIDLDFFREKFPQLDIDSIEVDFSETEWGSERLRRLMGKKLAGLKHIGTEVPALWIPIRKELEELRTKENAHYIERKRYFDICKKFGLNQTQDQLYLSRFLHRIGAILHYQDETDLLARTVILNPDWAIDAIYAALSDREKLKTGCFQFERAWLEDYWRQKGYELEEYEIFLTLMFKNRFEIAYSRKDNSGKDWVIVPELLPALPPVHDLDMGENPLVFRYEYEFMPEGLLSHFIVRMSEDIMEENNEQLVWKNGVYLHFNNSSFTKVRRLDMEGNRKIKFETNLWGSDREGYLWRIRREFEIVNKRFSDSLQPTELVPCICSECINAKTPQFYDLSLLLNFKAKSKPTKECPASGENVVLSQLLKYYDPETAIEMWGKERGGLIDTINILNQEKIKLENVLDNKGEFLDETMYKHIKSAIDSFDRQEYYTTAQSLWPIVEYVVDKLILKSLKNKKLSFPGLMSKFEKLKELNLIDVTYHNHLNTVYRNYLLHGNPPSDNADCKPLAQHAMLVLAKLIDLLP